MAIDSAIFGGGCFWCLDSVFRQVKGVTSSVCAYTAGHTANPSYDDICRGDSGHAEVVKISFDNALVSYETLLKILFSIHDPTTLNRQGNDVGTQYRSIILCHSQQQLDESQRFIGAIEASFSQPIVTQLQLLEQLYEAEVYHQNYFENNPGNGYCQTVIPPKLVKVADYFKLD